MALINHRFGRARVEPSPAPERRDRLRDWRQMLAVEPVLVANNRLKIFGQERSILQEEDWDHPGWERLWLYHAHYFDDLVAEGWQNRREWQQHLLQHWLEHNPAPRAPGWDPYPISRRIVNWVKWDLQGESLGDEARHSLAIQTRYLKRRLEYHLYGNHLIANAKALVFAGCYFAGREGETWLGEGLGLLTRELGDQILPDGGHHERSPMYHAIVLEDLLDVIQVLEAVGQAVPPVLEGHVKPMLHWLSCLTHPDGGPGFFNDTTGMQAPTFAGLRYYARRLGRVTELPDSAGGQALLPSGFVRMEKGAAVAVMDVGAPGPPHQPGHSHAESLSWEFSLGRQRVVVNSGISTYEHGAHRQRERGTAAHSTVSLANRDSSEMWGAFRVGRRARVRHGIVDPMAGVCQASHDGFGAVRHERRWEMGHGGLILLDHLASTSGVVHGGIHRVHIHPDVKVTCAKDGTQGELVLPGGESLVWRLQGARATLEDGLYAPAFGKRVPSTIIHAVFIQPEMTMELEWPGQ